MLHLIANGGTDVAVLAGEARGALRKKEAALKEALAGKLDAEYRFLLRQRLQQIELLRRQIEELNEQLAQATKDHIAVLRRLSQIPGVDLYAAQELLAEIGPRASAFAAAGGEHHEQQGFLRVKPVLRLLEDHRALAIHNGFGHFFAPPRGQAVHKHGIRPRLRHQLLIHLIRLKCLFAPRRLPLLSHAGPYIGIDGLRTRDRLSNIMGDGQRCTRNRSQPFRLRHNLGVW